jgi:protein-tyrosine phosphatase
LRRLDVSELVPGLLIGSAPSARARRQLSRLGITRVVDLRAETHAADPWGDDIAVTRLPIADGRAPDLDDLDAVVSAIDRWLSDGERVLVHCHAGIGRTGAIACALLVARGHDLADSYRLVTERRPAVAPTQAQLEALMAYQRRIETRRARRSGQHEWPAPRLRDVSAMGASSV